MPRRSSFFCPTKILKVRLLVLGWGHDGLAVAGAFFAVCLDVPPTFAARFLVCATNGRVRVVDGAKSPVGGLVLALCHFLRLGGTFCRLWGLRVLWGLLRGHSCAEKQKENGEKKRFHKKLVEKVKKRVSNKILWSMGYCVGKLAAPKRKD